MTRLETLLAEGLDLSGPVLVLRPPIGMELAGLGAHVVQSFKPAYDHFAARGLPVCVAASGAAEGEFAAALVCLTRSKEESRALIAEAAARAPLVLVDGQKTDGVESLLKEVKARASVGAVVSKAHGKLFVVEGGDFADWAARPGVVDGLRTVPGIFSAEKVDGGSAILAELLPKKLPAKLADLGAGWGYLSRAILARDGVEALHLVEAEGRALDCARLNLTDPRAVFHWADATTWRAPEPLGGVIMNPPFHQGRAAEPSLGQAFIAAAAAALAPHGKLWMVANRHLPYEAALGSKFAQVQELDGDNRFKVLFAEKPRRLRR